MTTQEMIINLLNLHAFISLSVLSLIDAVARGMRSKKILERNWKYAFIPIINIMTAVFLIKAILPYMKHGIKHIIKITFKD